MGIKKIIIGLCLGIYTFCGCSNENRCNPFVQVRYGLITTESISMPMGAE